MNQNEKPDPVGPLISNAEDFFKEAVRGAITDTGVETFPLAENYLVRILETYLSSENLFDPDSRRSPMLAEVFLKASNLPPEQRAESLKKMGDSSLYISGFFGDSFSRKIIDIDYYAEMGGAAYRSLAYSVSDELLSKVYAHYAERFLDYVEVLTLISQRSQVQNNNNLLRLYDRYLTTGSKLAEKELLERGVLISDLEGAKAKKQ